MDLYLFNEWWRTGKVRDSLKGKRRRALNDALRFLSKRQILLIEGLRRVGKTTLMFQIIGYLLSKGVSPFRILYYSFDEEVGSIEEIINLYKREILKEELSKEKIYIFFDEIQKHKNWWNKIKIFYDLYPNIKFFLSGSISTLIEAKSKESLAGRVFTYILKPLCFDEFLEFRKVKVDKERLNIYKDILSIELENYLKTSGFIEVIYEKDEIFIKRYFKEMVFDRILFKDIPYTFNIDEPDLLWKIFLIISKNPGMMIKYTELGNELKRDRRTIERYIGYLERSFLLFKLFNYSRNELTSRRKNKKIYPTQTSFSYSVNGNDREFFGKLVENLIVSVVQGRFFFRNVYKEEIDIIYKDDERIIPIEVKFRKKLSKSDIKTIKSFSRKFGVKKAIVVSEWDRGIIEENGIKIHIVPCVEFLLKWRDIIKL